MTRALEMRANVASSWEMNRSVRKPSRPVESENRGFQNLPRRREYAFPDLHLAARPTSTFPSLGIDLAGRKISTLPVRCWVSWSRGGCA